LYFILFSSFHFSSTQSVTLFPFDLMKLHSRLFACYFKKIVEWQYGMLRFMKSAHLKLLHAVLIRQLNSESQMDNKIGPIAILPMI
jgi:hypothetical protein